MHTTLLQEQSFILSACLLLTSLLLGVLLEVNGCPLDPINCTIPYDDLNISSVVIIDATQYCQIDNCIVKIKLEILINLTNNHLSKALSLQQGPKSAMEVITRLRCSNKSVT